MTKDVLCTVILGATSGMAEAYARKRASAGDHLILLARHDDRLEQIKAHLLADGASDVTTISMDLSETRNIARQVSEIRTIATINQVLLAYGTMDEQTSIDKEPAIAVRTLTVNTTSAILWLMEFAKLFEDEGQGTIAAITSVAGMRGRQSNYIYGASKSALSTCMEGLAHRFAQSDVHVVEIRPGFVDTPMTDGMKKGGLFWSTANQIAEVIDQAMSEKKKRLVYSKPIWWLVMMVIRHLPTFVFHRTKL
jgi:short-subunit dehydrogenase